MAVNPMFGWTDGQGNPVPQGTQPSQADGAPAAKQIYNPWNPNPNAPAGTIYAQGPAGGQNRALVAEQGPAYEKSLAEQQVWDAEQQRRAEAAAASGGKYTIQPYPKAAWVQQQKETLWQNGYDFNTPITPSTRTSDPDRMMYKTSADGKRAWYGSGAQWNDWKSAPANAAFFAQDQGRNERPGNMFNGRPDQGQQGQQQAQTGGENTDPAPAPADTPPPATTGTPPDATNQHGWGAQTNPYGDNPNQAAPVGPMGSPGQGSNMFSGRQGATGQSMSQQRGRPAGMLGGGIGRNQSPGWSQPIVSAYMGG